MKKSPTSISILNTGRSYKILRINSENSKSCALSRKNSRRVIMMMKILWNTLRPLSNQARYHIYLNKYSNT